MKIKFAYHYFYYKLYKLFQVDERDWWSEWKASLSLDVLISFVVLSGINYYTNLTKKIFYFGNGKTIVFILGILILTPNYFIFHHKDQWRGIVKRFDNLPKGKNRIGDWVVYSIVILLIANLIFSFYLMSQIDWKQYR